MKHKTEIESALQDRMSDVITCYLQHGYLPLWCGNISNEELQLNIESWVKNDNNFSQLKQIWELIADEDVKIRLQHQLSQPILEAMVINLQDIRPLQLEQITEDALILFALANKKDNIKKFVTLVKSALVAVLAREVEKRWDEVFANHILMSLCLESPSLIKNLEKNNTRLFSTAFIPVIEKIKSFGTININIHSIYKREITDKLKDDSERSIHLPDEGIEIQNAGLFLIIPFLDNFFYRTKVISQQHLVNASKAISLLNYIVTGNDAFAEFQVVFPKILTGLSPNKAIVSEYVLTSSDKTEVDKLLSVIDKEMFDNKSVDFLRKQVFQQKGLLTTINNKWLLHLADRIPELESYDLPGDNGISRLPWMKHSLKLVYS